MPPASRPVDVRTLAVAAAAWVGALLGRGSPAWAVGVGAALAAGAVGAWWCHRGQAGVTLLGALVVLGTVATVAGVRSERVTDNALTDLAARRSEVRLTAQVADDPVPVASRFGDEVMVRLDVNRVQAAGRSFDLRVPVLAFADPSWRSVPLGATVEVDGHLGPSHQDDVAAVLSARDGPRVRAPPVWWWRASSQLRAALRDSASRLPPEQRILVPALVDGDDAGLDPTLADDFRTTGLTHLLAVSGTNLTLVVGFVLAVARWLRVRGRWLLLVGAAGIVGFVLLARPEPSVLRAAAMGTVALAGLGVHGRDRGVRGLGVATVVLLLVDPGLASAMGFALSVCATAGILLLAPGWRTALARWLPTWLAEALAVPAAAQLACTPLVAAISGRVSLVAVAANLLAAPAVGPATVLGLVGGCLQLGVPTAGRLVGAAAGGCVAWIVWVARRGAGLPTPAVGWGSGPVALGLLTVVCLGLALLGPWLVGRRSGGIACCAVLAGAVLVRVPTPGWPPAGWLLVACDVGQGDGLVLTTGQPHTAVVVDAGPDPRLMDRCLDGLGITRVPLVVLTHFHADHVDGLSGVVSGRRVGEVDVSPLQDPPEGVSSVRTVATAHGLTPRVAPYAVTRSVGGLTLEAVWPLPTSPTTGPGDGSTANNASVVLLARVDGVTFFLAGDVEPEGQAALARALPGLRVDVLKVPHHGSRYQDLPFLESLRARVAVISVGADNDYGHPAPATVSALEHTGARVLRTDVDGAVAVVTQDGALAAVTRR
jgi:competence protein ComEC